MVLGSLDSVKFVYLSLPPVDAETDASTIFAFKVPGKLAGVTPSWIYPFLRAPDGYSATVGDPYLAAAGSNLGV